MAITVDTVATALKPYVRASDSDKPFVTECAQRALTLVTRLTGEHTVPDDVLTQATLEAGANLYARRIARNDVSNFSDSTLIAPPRLPALDPLTTARAILAPYLGAPIA